MSTSAFFIISSIFFYSDSMTAKFCKQSLFLRILGKSRKYMQLHFLCLVQDQLVFLFPFLQKLDSESRYPFSPDRHSQGRARSPNKPPFPWINIPPRIPARCCNSAPIWVGTIHCALQKIRGGDRSGGRPSVFFAFGPIDRNFNKLCRSFRVFNHELRDCNE